MYVGLSGIGTTLTECPRSSGVLGGEGVGVVVNGGIEAPPAPPVVPSRVGSTGCSFTVGPTAGSLVLPGTASVVS